MSTVYHMFIQRVNNSKNNDNKVSSYVSRWEQKIGELLNNQFIVAAERIHSPKQNESGQWVLTVKIEVRSDKNIDNKITSKIEGVINKYCTDSAWGNYKWTTNQSKEFIDPSKLPEAESVEDSDIWIPYAEALDWDEFSTECFDEFIKLTNSTDEEIENHKWFKGIYNMGAHIRILSGNIARAMETSGKSREHILMYGPPGCGKTTLLRTLAENLPNGSVLELSANMTTKAGFEKKILHDLKEVGFAPLFFIEEPDKAPENNMNPFLGIMDKRGMFEKNTAQAKRSGRVEVLSMVIFAANNKRKFDNMLDGAIASRTTSKMIVESPDYPLIKKILVREIDENGGNEKWIDPAVEFAQELNVRDPRIIIGFLAGRDRLLDGSYQKDRLMTWEKEENTETEEVETYGGSDEHFLKYLTSEYIRTKKLNLN